MTEKQKRFLEECKTVAISNEITDRFAKVVVERMEEISRTALAANNPVHRLEDALVVAAFKTLADSMYNALDTMDKSVCDIFMELCDPVLYFVSKEG